MKEAQVVSYIHGMSDHIYWCHVLGTQNKDRDSNEVEVYEE